jgi:methionyl-tRNA formyltransferase
MSFSPPASRLLQRRKLAFFGSPAWSVPVLQALHMHHDVALVVTQPDKPAGRGLQLTPCPVAQWAKAHSLRLEQPKTLKGNLEFIELFKSLHLDVAVTAAYGKILPGVLLELPRFGFLNLHPSDLPKYRGPAPVQWTLINGETETAVSIMRTDVGMDTGPVVSKWHTPIGPDETALELSNRLRDKGIELLMDALEGLEHLSLTPQPQAGSHARLLEKEDGKIAWERSSQEIYNRHRGVQPWPGSWFEHGGKRVKVLRMSKAERWGSNVAPGTVVGIGGGLEVATGQGGLVLEEVQLEGRRPMPALEWARGARISAGDRL